MVVLKLNMSSSRGQRQKLHKVAHLEFERGQRRKKSNFWLKIAQKSIFLI
jgi:hypothetical protein